MNWNTGTCCSGVTERSIYWQKGVNQQFFMSLARNTVDGRNPAKQRGILYKKPCKSWEFNNQCQLVLAGFLNHQQ